MKNKEKREKENKVPRLVSLALMMVLITTCLLSNTLAKYVVRVYGTDTARVAQIDFGGTITTKDELDAVLSDDEPLATAGTDIEIFKTVYSNEEGGYTVAESPYTTASGIGEVIAPGVKGSFILDINGGTEVSINIALSIKETQKLVQADGTESSNSTPVPMVYKYNGKYYFADDLYGEDVEAAIAAGSTLYLDLDNSVIVLIDTSISFTPVNSSNYGGNLKDLADLVAATIGEIAPGLIGSSFTVEWYWAFDAYINYNFTDDITTTPSTTLVTDVDLTDLSTAYDTALSIMLHPTDVSATVYTPVITLDFGATATQID